MSSAKIQSFQGKNGHPLPLPEVRKNAQRTKMEWSQWYIYANSASPWQRRKRLIEPENEDRSSCSRQPVTGKRGPLSSQPSHRCYLEELPVGSGRTTQKENNDGVISKTPFSTLCARSTCDYIDLVPFSLLALVLLHLRSDFVGSASPPVRNVAPFW